MTNEEAIKTLKKLKSFHNGSYGTAIDEAIKALEQTRPKGTWIFKNDNIAIPTGYYQCSECKEGKLLVKDNYCPNCGSYNGGSEE